MFDEGPVVVLVEGGLQFVCVFITMGRARPQLSDGVS